MRLEEAINIFQTRLRWLTSDSRRLFGVISDKCVCLVIDCKQRDLNQFRQFKNSILNLMCEQISRLNMFNIIRCGNGQLFESFRPQACNVSKSSIDEALEWLNNTCFCHFERGSHKDEAPADSSTCEAIIQAFQDPYVSLACHILFL